MWRRCLYIFFCGDAYTFFLKHLAKHSVSRYKLSCKGAIINFPTPTRRGFWLENSLFTICKERYAQSFFCSILKLICYILSFPSKNFFSSCFCGNSRSCQSSQLFWTYWYSITIFYKLYYLLRCFCPSVITTFYSRKTGAYYFHFRYIRGIILSSIFIFGEKTIASYTSGNYYPPHKYEYTNRRFLEKRTFRRVWKTLFLRNKKLPQKGNKDWENCLSSSKKYISYI